VWLLCSPVEDLGSGEKIWDRYHLYVMVHVLMYADDAHSGGLGTSEDTCWLGWLRRVLQETIKSLRLQWTMADEIAGLRNSVQDQAAQVTHSAV